jgi:hypothetical protein
VEAPPGARVNRRSDRSAADPPVAVGEPAAR